ncbi:hypothetical protein EMIT0P291_310029 [Pseudomonas sp. IT-P291]
MRRDRCHNGSIDVTDAALLHGCECSPFGGRSNGIDIDEQLVGPHQRCCYPSNIQRRIGGDR